MSKIGFFGGCFNPPTEAHIELAKKAIKFAKLDKVVFVPMGNCYQKEDLIDIKYRYEMLKITTHDEEKIEISKMQFNQKKRNYAIDSFSEIDNNYDGEKFYIMGEDNFKKINSWKSPEELKKHNFIVFRRDKDENTYDAQNVLFINTLIYKDVSSSQIRNAIREKQNNLCFIKKDVLKYIQENNLYK